MRTPLFDTETILTEAQVNGILDEHRVSRDDWGTGRWRSFDKLMDYHENDRLYFRNGTCKRFIIDVNVAVVIVLYKHRGRWFELYEDYQQFPDGSTNRRTEFDGIGETMRRSENPVESWRRCLKEELGFDDPRKYQLQDTIRLQVRPPRLSEKWNGGVWAVYHRHIIECVISRELFGHGEGYEEKEKDVKVFFKWRPRGQLEFPEIVSPLQK